MNRFDITFTRDGASIDYHFCKEEECFGTNEDHGYSFDEAKEAVTHYLEKELKVWGNMTFEDWRRANHPTEDELNDYLSMAEDIDAMQEEEWLARN